MRAPRWLRPLIAVVGLTLVGLVCAGYVLVKERVSIPFRSTYDVSVQLASADGVAPGLGQPVLVSGVRVGVISAAEVVGGSARVVLQIKRDKLPRIYRDAAATLTPSTPLKDMQIDLDPGTVRAGPAADGWTISSARTQVPVELADLLSALDGDTREYLSTMLASLGDGLTGRGPDLRHALVSFSATTGQLRTVSSELAQRRRAIARLVRDLAAVTRAASQDEELSSLVVAGRRTLAAVAGQDRALGASLRRLPQALRDGQTAVDDIAGLTDEAARTGTALAPVLRGLPDTLKAFTPFAKQATATLRGSLRPLVREVQPVLRDAGPAVAAGLRMLPAVRRTAKILVYTANELAYNPPGDDEGYLFWSSWFAHNANSSFSTQDAHGSLGRASVFVSCQQLTDLASLGTILKLVLGQTSVCP
ncbi:MAG: hypothetical protein JWR63_1423 [Conexibacter sp.]|nr:hypothetical protein [Conexibacter sp.]